MSRRIPFVCLGSVALLLLVPISCTPKEASTAEAKKPAPAPAQTEPVCKEGSKQLRPDGKLKECTLAQDWVNGPYTCRTNWGVVFHENGKLKECKISGTADFSGLLVKDSLTLYDDGKFRRGIVAAAKAFGDVEAREGDWITLFPSGALNRLELTAGPRALKGYPCKGSENYFHENGQLKKCTLGQPFKVGEKELPPDTLLCFDESGKAKEPCNVMSP